MAGDIDVPSQADQLRGLLRENQRLRAALERVEAHGSGCAVKLAREALEAPGAPQGRRRTKDERAALLRDVHRLP